MIKQTLSILMIKIFNTFKLILVLIFSLGFHNIQAQDNYIFKKSDKSLLIKQIKSENKSSDSYNFTINNLLDENIILKIKSQKSDRVFLQQLVNGKFITQKPLYNIENAFKIFRGKNNYKIKIKSLKKSIILIELYEEGTFINKRHINNILISIIFGALLLIILYNLILFSTVKDYIYLFFVIFVFFTFIFFASESNFEKLLNPIISLNYKYTFIIFDILCYLSAILFSIKYLNIEKYFNNHLRYFYYFSSIFIIVIILSYLKLYQSSILIFEISKNILNIYIFIIAIISIKKGNSSAKFFAFSWSFYMVGSFINTFKSNYNNTISNFLYNYEQLGLILNIILLSLVIGNKLNIIKKEKEKEEAQSLHFLKEKESIIIKQNLILEERVQERNKELLKTNEILDSQKEKIEEQISKIEKSNKELKKFNKKLSSKNSKILIKNEELQLFKKSLEETIKEKTYDLKKAKKRAIIAEKLKSSFLNNMTNEIKDPINNITGFSNLLLDKNLTEIKRNEYLNIIIHNVDKLLEQIDDIVTISRIQTGIVKLREESFDMNSIFDPLIEEFNEKLKFWDKKLKIIKRIPENIKIKADYNKLWTILHKLIGNSIKYTKSGTIELGFNKIDLNKSFQNFINLEIFIKDTGSGFETEKLNKLFIRLNEIHEDKTKIYHEIGTGLAIVKGYVDILKGNISVESKINEGTIFLIEIPVLVL